MMNTKRTIRILYVEDDETIAFLTKDNLEMRGYSIEHVPDGQKALEIFKAGNFDLCLLDIMLPELDGYSLAGEIRKINPSVPLLFLTAKSMTEDKIRGFSLGGDDFITKPFSIDELVMRIEVFLKRSRIDVNGNQNLISLGSMRFDYSNQLLVINRKETHLTQRENELLYYLLKHADQLVKREDILKDIWGDDDYFLGRSLDVFISRLRKMLTGEPAIHIENIHGVGFRVNTKK